MTYENHYVEGRWQDKKRFSCKHDQYDTFSLDDMKAHIDEQHPDNAPLADVEIIRRDRFGNTIDPNASLQPPATKEPAAPRSKEVSDDWDPHASHEERGLPIPKLNEHAKRALKKSVSDPHTVGPVLPEEPKAKSKAEKA